MEETKKNNLTRRLILFVLCGYFILSFFYLFKSPLWSPPDEIRHFSYCEYIARNHSLPYLDAKMDGGHVTQAVHPPLYYLIGSFFCSNLDREIQEIVFINSGPNGAIISHPEKEVVFPYYGKARGAYLLRLFSILCGALTVWLIFKITLLIYPDNPLYAVLASVFVATLPQFLYVSASISNENLSTFLTTLYIFYLLTFLQDRISWEKTLLTGVTLGCCLLTKSSTMFCVPLTVFVFCLIWFRYRNEKHFLKLVIILSLGGVLSSWWYIRNWYLYNDPIFTKALEALQPWSLRSHPFTFDYICEVFSRSIVSFFGNFGSMHFPITPGQLLTYSILSCCAVVGLTMSLKKNIKNRFTLQSIMTLLVCFLGALCFFVLANIRYAMFMGRYFFVAIAPISVFFSIGIVNLFPRLPGKIFYVICLLVLVGLSVDVFGRIVLPAYQNYYLTKMIEQNDFSRQSEVVSETSLIKQTFLSRQNNLSTVRFLFSVSSNHETWLSIKEVGEANPVLFSTKFRPEVQDRFRYGFFMFPPLNNSKGKQYEFTVSSFSTADEESTLALWYSPKDVYKSGQMYVNQTLTGGDLCFSTYYCDNPEFVDKWHNSRQVIIREKPFIDFSELQLYYEMEKDFKTHSVIQLKIDQIGDL